MWSRHTDLLPPLSCFALAEGKIEPAIPFHGGKAALACLGIALRMGTHIQPYSASLTPGLRASEPRALRHPSPSATVPLRTACVPAPRPYPFSCHPLPLRVTILSIAVLIPLLIPTVDSTVTASLGSSNDSFVLSEGSVHVSAGVEQVVATIVLPQPFPCAQLLGYMHASMQSGRGVVCREG